jgi:hypothetical protein
VWYAKLVSGRALRALLEVESLVDVNNLRTNLFEMLSNGVTSAGVSPTTITITSKIIRLDDDSGDKIEDCVQQRILHKIVMVRS